MDKAYAFSDRSTLERVINLLRKPTDLTNEGRKGFGGDVIWAEVTEKISDTEAKCKQVFRKNDGSTVDYSKGLVWDEDEDQSQINNLPNLKAFEGYSFPDEEGIVEAVYLALDDDSGWYGFPPASGGGIDLYRVITANYNGNPELENLYTVRKTDNYFYDDTVIPEPDDIEALVSAEGFPFGLVVGKVYESFSSVGATPALKAPERYPVKYEGGWKLFDSHQGNSLKNINGLIEVLSLPNITASKYEGIYLDGFWDQIREKLTVYIPSM